MEDFTVKLSGNAIQINAQKKLIEKIVKMSSEDRALFSELANNQKAIDGLKANKAMLLQMLQ